MSVSIIHIGPHKTGTTTIQNYLAINRAVLLERGIDYPVLGRRAEGAQAHRHLAALMRNIPAEIPEGFAGALAGWRPGAPRAVFSSEDFYFGSSIECVQRLAALVPEIDRVVAFARSPVSHLVSHYYQVLKTRSIQTLQDFVTEQQHAMTAIRPGFAYYRFDRNLAAWRSVAPLHLVPFGARSRLLPAFFDACGLPFDPGLPGADAVENPSPPPVVMALRLALNRALARQALSPEWFRDLQRRLSRHDPRDLEARFGARTQVVTVDTTGFCRAFGQHNPGYAAIAPADGAPAVTHEIPAGQAAQVLAELGEMVPA